MTTQPLTSREQVAHGIGRFLVRFQKWIAPETELMRNWQNMPKPYVVVKGSMQMDLANMLDEMRQHKIPLPIASISLLEISAPPDLSQVIGVPWDIDTVFKEDPQRRKVKVRTEPRTYHVQIVFFANDPDSASSFANQFSSYIKLQEVRRFEVPYKVAEDVILKEWMMTIFDNNIYPDKADLEEKNIFASTVEFDISGLIPQVTHGYGFYTAIDRDVPGDTWGVVTEADFYKDRENSHFVRVNADPETKERTTSVHPKQ